MGTEFVASHIWRVVDHEKLASRIPLLNTFVPNLVWLPSQVAKLSDREGEVVQRTLQAMAYRIYRNAPVQPHAKERAEEAWSMIPPPDEPLEPFADSDLNWFEATPAFRETRINRIESVMAALDLLAQGRPLPERVVTTRYAAGLPMVSESKRHQLRDFLGSLAGPSWSKPQPDWNEGDGQKAAGASGPEDLH